MTFGVEIIIKPEGFTTLFSSSINFKESEICSMTWNVMATSKESVPIDNNKAFEFMNELFSVAKLSLQYLTADKS